MKGPTASRAFFCLDRRTFRGDESVIDQSKLYTTKQMGDACEMLVAAELTLAGVPAMKAPDYWPGYDVIAQLPTDAEPQRISVKARTFKTGAAFVRYDRGDRFDWLAIVLLNDPLPGKRRLFLVPRSTADGLARTYKTDKMKDVFEYRIDEVAKKFGEFENNFRLHAAPRLSRPIATAE